MKNHQQNIILLVSTIRSIFAQSGGEFIGNIELTIGPDSLILPEKTTVSISTFDLSKNYSTRGTTETLRRFNSMSDMVYRHIIATNRGGSYNPKQIEEKLQNYGCYCFPKNSRNVAKNKGAPVDKMDQLCRMLSQCHRCIYDYDYVDDECDFFGKYKYDVNANNGIISCLPGNRGCQSSQCECDKEFARRIVDLWVADDSFEFDNFFWLNKNNVGDKFSYSAFKGFGPVPKFVYFSKLRVRLIDFWAENSILFVKMVFDWVFGDSGRVLCPE